MRLLTLVVLACAALLAQVAPAAAQGPPPKIGPFALDLHGTVPRFPNDDQQLADSRDLLVGELPHTGLGIHSAATVYVFKWKAVTFGLGADLTLARAHSSGVQLSETTFGRPTTEQFRHIAPELSFNFGDGNGWSYISGGIGPATWSIVPDNAQPTAADTERVQTINYGGGARWFIRPHVAFSFDVRFYAMNPTTPLPDHPPGPRTTLLIMGAGVSIK